jgi:uncharacterized protein (DUF362 family)
MAATVAITQNFDIGQAIAKALDEIDVDPLVRGKSVAVKNNETWASKDDKTGVTQPDTLRAVLRYLKRYDPREIVVTGGSGAGETDEIFRLVGLMDVVEEEGATFFDHNRPPFESIDLRYRPDLDVRGPQRSVMVNPRVLEYDSLVLVSQLKLHRTATVTLSLKNIAMSFPAADYYGHPRSKEDHENDFYDDMHSFIASMAQRFPIDLAIIAGHPAMIATGPLGGKAVETGVVIASTDAVAADVVGAKLLGFNVQAVRHLWEAEKLGLGETKIDKMDFPLMDSKEAIEAFTEAAYGKRMTYESA